jgi:hypothetical protein
VHIHRMPHQLTRQLTTGDIPPHEVWSDEESPLIQAMPVHQDASLAWTDQLAWEIFTEILGSLAEADPSSLPFPLCLSLLSC